MDEPRFVLPKKRFTGTSVVLSMRIPNDMLTELDKIASKTGRTRNEILMLSLEFAIDHLEIKNKDNGGN